MNDFIDFSIIDSELKAYLIGFFYADAYLSDYVISVNLSIKDKNYLEKLAQLLNKSTFERTLKNKNGKTYYSIGFNICNKKTIDSLKKIGFIKRKTYQNDDIVFTNIPEEYKNHFIRGYFDGDGMIIFSNWKNKNHDWNQSSKCVIGFVSQNKKLLESINNYLISKLYLEDKERVKIDINKNINNNNNWRLLFNGNKISKTILDFLYQNSTIFMERKYNEYLKIKEYKPKGYHFHKKSNRWRTTYEDENGIKKMKTFKNEIDIQNFLEEINNEKIIKTYEKFISKMVK